MNNRNGEWNYIVRLYSFSSVEEHISGYVVPYLSYLYAAYMPYEMSSATATAVGDNTSSGRNRLPPWSPLNSTSYQVLSCCWTTTVIIPQRWWWSCFADVEESAAEAVSVDGARRRFKGVLCDIVRNGSHRKSETTDERR